jgi:hypothetical protein
MHVEAILQIGPCVLQKSTHSPKSTVHIILQMKPYVFIKSFSRRALPTASFPTPAPSCTPMRHPRLHRSPPRPPVGAGGDCSGIRAPFYPTRPYATLAAPDRPSPDPVPARAVSGVLPSPCHPVPNRPHPDPTPAPRPGFRARRMRSTWLSADPPYVLWNQYQVHPCLSFFFILFCIFGSSKCRRAACLLSIGLLTATP